MHTYVLVHPYMLTVLYTPFDIAEDSIPLTPDLSAPAMLLVRLERMGALGKYSRQTPCMSDVLDHRRRTKTEEKAKNVTAVWGTELTQFLAACTSYFPP